MLSSNEFRRITGVGASCLDKWIKAGFLSPSNAGQGTGNHRRYSLGDAVAVTAGLRYREAGAGPDRVAGVVRLLATLGLERLEAELEAGRTFPVPTMMVGVETLPDVMVEPPMGDELTPGARKLLASIDLEKIVADVKAKAEKLNRPKAKKAARV